VKRFVPLPTLGAFFVAFPGMTALADVVTLFDGDIVLGRPTAISIGMKLFSPDQNGTAVIECGTVSGALTMQSAPSMLQSATPLLLNLSGLNPDTKYYYRLSFQAAGESMHTLTGKHGFHR
jgi:hypothetical protein